MRITKKADGLSLTKAFAEQRKQDGNSAKLRASVARLLNPGKASTEVVGEVFDLIVRRMASTGRITRSDVQSVLTGFDVD